MANRRAEFERAVRLIKAELVLSAILLISGVLVLASRQPARGSAEIPIAATAAAWHLQD